jgi:hypothetical protein
MSEADVQTVPTVISGTSSPDAAADFSRHSLVVVAFQLLEPQSPLCAFSHGQTLQIRHQSVDTGSQFFQVHALHFFENEFWQQFPVLDGENLRQNAVLTAEHQKCKCNAAGSREALEAFKCNEEQKSGKRVTVTLSMSLHFCIRPSSSRRMAAACSSIESSCNQRNRQGEKRKRQAVRRQIAHSGEAALSPEELT